MKVYFDNGQLKIFIGEEKTETRKAFLHEIYYIPTEWSDEPFTLKLVSDFSERTMEGNIKNVIRTAKFKEIEVSDEANKLYMDIVAKHKKEAEAKAYKEALEKDITSVNNRLSNGCGLCSHLRYDQKNNVHFCDYTLKPTRYRNEDIEYEFECRKEAKALGTELAFMAVPYPVAGCEYIVKGQKAYAELEKKIKGEEGNGQI